jgi:hypothetical protein
MAGGTLQSMKEVSGKPIELSPSSEEGN